MTDAGSVSSYIFQHLRTHYVHKTVLPTLIPALVTKVTVSHTFTLVGRKLVFKTQSTMQAWLYHSSKLVQSLHTSTCGKKRARERKDLLRLGHQAAQPRDRLLHHLTRHPTAPTLSTLQDLNFVH